MTDQDQLGVLIERAIDGRLLDREGPELRAAVQRLRDRARIAEDRAEDWRRAARRSLHLQLAAEKEAAEARAAAATLR